MIWYTLASLLPACVLAAAITMGGFWIYAALAVVSVGAFAADKASSFRIEPRADDDAIRQGQFLCVTIGFVHFLLLIGGVFALSDVGIPLVEKVALFAALGIFFGQISNSNAHELIHSPRRGHRRLGIWIYVSLLFGHHVSAHLRVHHVWVATTKDPNTARLNEGFYHFWKRAWIGSFLAGWRAESEIRAKTGKKGLHPYSGYAAGALISIAGAGFIGGGAGIFWLLALAIYAQMQLLISDYVQHYGLQRYCDASGRPEPVGPAHSWNARHWYSTAMMLNAPRHSDHHMYPARTFPALRVDEQSMPVLPSTFPLMGVLAVVPPLWRRVMNPRVAAVSDLGVGHLETNSGPESGDLSDLQNVKSDIDSGLPDSNIAERAKPDDGRSV